MFKKIGINSLNEAFDERYFGSAHSSYCEAFDDEGDESGPYWYCMVEGNGTLQLPSGVEVVDQIEDDDELKGHRLFFQTSIPLSDQQVEFFGYKKAKLPEPEPEPTDDLLGDEEEYNIFPDEETDPGDEQMAEEQPIGAEQSVDEQPVGEEEEYNIFPDEGSDAGIEDEGPSIQDVLDSGGEIAQESFDGSKDCCKKEVWGKRNNVWECITEAPSSWVSEGKIPDRWKQHWLDEEYDEVELRNAESLEQNPNNLDKLNEDGQKIGFNGPGKYQVYKITKDGQKALYRVANFDSENDYNKVQSVLGRQFAGALKISEAINEDVETEDGRPADRLLDLMNSGAVNPAEVATMLAYYCSDEDVAEIINKLGVMDEALATTGSFDRLFSDFAKGLNKRLMSAPTVEKSSDNTTTSDAEVKSSSWLSDAAQKVKTFLGGGDGSVDAEDVGTAVDTVSTVVDAVT